MNAAERCEARNATGNRDRCARRATHRHYVDGHSGPQVLVCRTHAAMLERRARRGSEAEVLAAWGFEPAAAPPLVDARPQPPGEAMLASSPPLTEPL